MKKKYIHIAIFSFIALLFGCKDNMSIKSKNPDAKFVCKFVSDGSIVQNNATITVNDKVVFSSVGKYDECAKNFVLFSGVISPNHKYQPVYTMQGSTQKLTDSIQGARGVGEILDTIGGKFVSNQILYSTPGTYTIYTVASFINKKTGEYKEALDSMVINVIDPNLNSTQLSSLIMSPSNGRGSPVAARITQDSIVFANVTVSNSTLFSGGQGVLNYTPLTMTIKKGDLEVKTNETKLKLIQGDVLTVTSPNGLTHKDYIVGIYIFKSSNPSITKASVSQASGYLFTDVCTIVGTTLQLPNWPKGTPSCSLKVSATGVTDKLYYVKTSDIDATKITSIAQDGITKLEYSLKAPLKEYDASILGFSFTKDPSNHISSSVVGKVTNYIIYSADTSLKKGTIKFSLNPYATVKYDNTSTDYSALKDFNNDQIDLSGKIVLFRVYNGTDSLDVKVNGIVW